MKAVKIHLPEDIIIHLKKTALLQGITMSELARKKLRADFETEFEEAKGTRPQNKIPKKGTSPGDSKGPKTNPFEFCKKHKGYKKNCGCK